MQSIKTRQFNSNIKSLICKLKMKLYNLLIKVLMPMKITELGIITYNKSTWRAHTCAKACNNK